jgi:hypothetical protein
MPAYGRKTACKLFCKAGGQGWRARLPGKAAGQGCRARVHLKIENRKSKIKIANCIAKF